MANPLVALFATALAGTMLLNPEPRRRIAFIAAFLVLVVSLVVESPARPVGDAREYVLMSINLARFEKPSATADDLAQIPTLFPGVTAEGLTRPWLQGPDQRQDFPHFWLYSLLAAPFVGVARLVGAHPVAGFTALNVLMLIGVASLVLERRPPAVALFVVAGPILWWVDKAHTEVLTFAVISVALLTLESKPWWAIIALGVAASQNPAAAGALAVAIGFGLYSRGWRDRRVWAAAVLASALAALHPLYFYSRLRLWSGLYDGVDPHWPGWRELTAAAFDPNLGIFVHDPLLLLAMAIALVEAITRPRRAAAVRDRSGPTAADVSMAVMALLFLVSFTQTTNFNSGGTPAPSRYGLCLVPFAIPVLARALERARWIKVLAAGSVAWCVWAFDPILPDQYLQPTTLAAELWQRRPALDNPLAEVFAERTGGREPARPPVATPGCEKVLTVGDGSDAAWPSRCTSVPVPSFCQVKGALCYANRAGNGYRFVQAQSPPAWRTAIARGEAPGFMAGTLVIAQSHEPKIPLTIWHQDGWSYPERLTEPTQDIVSREWRWMGDRASLGVTSAEPVAATLKIVARALARPRRLRLSIGGIEITTLLVSTARAEYQTPAFMLPAGTKLIDLESLDGADTAGDDDLRRLSMAIFRIELVPRR